MLKESEMVKPQRIEVKEMNRKETDIMKPFRAKKDDNICELSIVVVRKTKKIVDEKEVIDSYEGPIGRRYTENLLFRWGNHIATGTEFENIPWEKIRQKFKDGNPEIGYIKSTEDGSSYLLAKALWCLY